MTPALVWSDTPPSAAEYIALRASAGLGPRTHKAAEIALPASLCAVTARAEGRLIAMGRLVGDGGCFAQVVDMAVDPDWQGQGIGAEVLARLIRWAEATLPDCCHLSLVSSPAAEPLYRRAGFDLCRGMDRYAGPARLSPSLASE